MVQLGQRGEQTGALSASRRPRDQDHTLARRGEAPDELEIPP
jgi:hypothetical protein